MTGDLPRKLRKLVERPPRRIAPEVVSARRAKCIRRGGHPSTWLTVCCENQGWRCHYCGTLMRKKPGRNEQHLRATLDHVIPLSAGGHNCRSNIVAACTRCNAEKGSMPASEYKAIWAARHEARRRDSRSKPEGPEPLAGPVHESGGAEANRPNTVSTY